MPESGPRCSCWRVPCARLQSCGACFPQSSPSSPPEQGEQVISSHSVRPLSRGFLNAPRPSRSTQPPPRPRWRPWARRAGAVALCKSTAARCVSGFCALSARQSTRLRPAARCECTRGVRASVTRTAGEADARSVGVQETALTLAGDGLRKALQGATAHAAAVQAIAIPDAHTQGVLRVATHSSCVVVLVVVLPTCNICLGSAGWRVVVFSAESGEPAALRLATGCCVFDAAQCERRAQSMRAAATHG